MAQTYTLDEAARRLSLSPEEFKRRIKDEWKSVRSFRAGPTLRFRAADIDELARMMGEASDPGLQLGAVGDGSGEAGVADDSDHFAITDDHPSDGPSTVASGVSGPFRPAADPPLGLDAAPPAFDFTDSGSKAKFEKTGTDSDVRVEPAGGSGRLGLDAVGQSPTEEIALDLSGPGSAIIRPSSSAKLTPGASGKLSGPPSGKLAGPPSGKLAGPPSGKIPGPTSGKVNPADGSSEFELSLDADSDSFELQLAGDGSDEVGLDLSPPPGDRGGLSGINLGRPADSGISLRTSPRLSKTPTLASR